VILSTYAPIHEAPYDISDYLWFAADQKSSRIRVGRSDLRKNSGKVAGIVGLAAVRRSKLRAKRAATG
jgi:hypothetical protein